MYIIAVAPLKKGMQNVGTLTYFSGTSYPPGTIVTIPLRSKNTLAMVLKNTPVGGAKTALRAATFSLKKLPVQGDVAVLPEVLQKTAAQLAKAHPASIGEILLALLPPEIKNGLRPWPQLPAPPQHETKTVPEAPGVLGASRTDRYIEYRSLVRETFARGGTVVLVVPTNADIQFAKETLEHGIEDRVVTFSSVYGKKHLDRAYDTFTDFRKAKLIITTPTHAYLDRYDIELIIVDDARSPHYTMRQRPYLDHREILTQYAEIANRTILFGDILLRTEHEALRREDVYATHGEHAKRLALPAKLKLVQLNKAPTTEKPFELLSESIVDEIEQTLTDKGLVFMHAARRGMAPVVACSDCGFIFRCPESGAPYSLLREYVQGEEKRWFVSNTSGQRVRAEDICTECGSWRLKERGIGIQQIHDAVCKRFPNRPVVLFDHTTATTYKKARTLIDDFYNAKRGAILLGTNMVLPYIKSPVEMSVITSLDALSAAPTWRVSEDMLGLLLTLREQSKKTVHVQARHEVPEIIKYASEGSIEQFYTDELELRKMLAYPPFSRFIHLSWSGSPESAKETEDHITNVLNDYPLTVYRAPTSSPKVETRYGLIRLTKAHAESDEVLRTLLSELPPSIKITQNPDRII